VLPALFGLTIAVTLRLGTARTILVSVLSVAAYQSAILTSVGVDKISRWLTDGPAGSLAAVAVAGAVGALVVLASIGLRYRPSFRTIVQTAAAGAIGGATFDLVKAGQEGDRLPAAVSYIVWQVLAGLVIVDRTPLPAEKKYVPLPIKPIGVVFALAIAVCAIGSWVRSWPVPWKAGDSQQNPRDKSSYVWIPPGEYQMGCSPDDSDCDSDEQPAHKVTFAKGFWLGSTEVTVKSFRAIMGTDKLPPPAMWAGVTHNPNWKNEQMPIVNVTWQEARDYCRAVDGRLPTEAEWEYAARAGTVGARYGRIREVARYSENSGADTLSTSGMSDDQLRQAVVSNRNTMQNVGGMSGNAWGLEDMLGNVAERVEDDYDAKSYSTSSGGVTDPRPYVNRSGLASKIVRGGAWVNRARAVRASFRGFVGAGDRSAFIGFRCVWDGPAARR
jgi:formylglycine-generating enzyme required for sulfatase activity